MDNKYNFFYSCKYLHIVMVWLCYLKLNKSLINVYTIKLTKHKNDRPHGIVRNNVGILISILISLIVQLVNVIFS